MTDETGLVAAEVHVRIGEDRGHLLQEVPEECVRRVFGGVQRVVRARPGVDRNLR